MRLHHRYSVSSDVQRSGSKTGIADAVDKGIRSFRGTAIGPAFGWNLDPDPIGGRRGAER
jgi:hypothetical protein